MPGATSGIISNEARGPNEAQTTRNRTIRIMPSIKNRIRIPSLTHRDKGLCIEWSRKCMAADMKTVLFTDENHA